jgi:hypothetical protein
MWVFLQAGPMTAPLLMTSAANEDVVICYLKAGAVLCM